MPFRNPFATDEERSIAARFGMGLFLLALAMLFAGSIVGYIVIRLQTDAWPDDIPPLPSLLWVSTLILLISSGTIQLAVVAQQRENNAGLRAGLFLTLLLGLAFLTIQSIAWLEWTEAIGDRWNVSDAYRMALAGFYVLTGVHAFHVIGGIIPMLVVIINALRTSDPIWLKGTAVYWHFLDLVWIMLLATLLIVT